MDRLRAEAEKEAERRERGERFSGGDVIQDTNVSGVHRGSEASKKESQAKKEKGRERKGYESEPNHSECRE